MPIGPNGEKRPAAVIANAVISMRIATGEADETIVKAEASPGVEPHAVLRSGRRLSRVAMLAAVARWGPPRRDTDIALGGVGR